MPEVLQEALTALKHNRRRSALTMLGMAWGIATVVLLLAYGNGFSRAVETVFASFGVKTMILIPGRSSMQAGGEKAGARIRFTLDDMDVLTTNVPQITRITPETSKQCAVQFDTRTFNVIVNGDYPNVTDIRILTLAQGRFYNADDLVARGRVAMLSSDIKDKLFSGRNAVGERVRIDGISFEVIGVLQPKMQQGNDNVNDVVYIPYNAMGNLTDIHYVGSFMFNYEDDDFLGLEKTVREVLAIQHRFNPADRRALLVFNLMDQVHQFRLIALGLRVLLAFIGTLTLGIGGVGLMNIMLVSVTQRTREIGMLKALGCPRTMIFRQFLTEALAISFAGGICGVLLAYIVSLSVGRLTLYSAMAKHAEGGDIRLLIDPLTLVIATLILTLVGLVSGMLPAMRASRLDPIEALRYE
ncbi:MAG TPA: ABC transporter permease [Candidatus Koribacter sp.]|jgi:putative ABC transport system permease protein